MAAPIRPATVKTRGKDDWTFVPTIATITAPTLAEITAAGSLRISCFLFASSAQPTQSTNLVSANKRICDTQTYQVVGDTSLAGGELHYSIDPQASGASDALKAWTTLGGELGGVTGFLARRLAIAMATDHAVGQFFSIYPIELSPGLITTEGDDEAAEASVTQTFAITGPIARRVALVA